MEIHACLPIRNGRPVHPAGVEGPAGAQTEALRLREAGARRLHVIDVDAATGHDNQWRQVARLAGLGMPVRVAGGVRHMIDIQQLLDLGARHVAVGTQAVRNPLWARELVHVFPGRVILALDSRDRGLLVDGRSKDTGLDAVETVRGLDDAGLAGVLYTDVGRSGAGAGFDEAAVRDLRDAAQRTPLHVAGGLRGQEDLEALERLGVDGVVLHRSLHEGLDLAAATDRFENAVA